MTTVDTDNNQGRPDDEAATVDTDDLDLEEQEDAELWAELDGEEGDVAEAPDATGADDDEQFTASEDTQPDDDPTPADDESAGEPAAADDPFANASPEQRAAWSAAQAQIAKLEQSDRSQRGRLGAMQRQVNDLMAKATTGEAPESAPAAQKANTTEGSYLDSDDYKKFEEEYPEVAGPFSKIISGLESRLAKYDERFSAEETVEIETAIDEQTARLTEAHPDWQDVLAAEDSVFMEWLADEPRHVKEAAYRNAEVIVDADEAADVFSRFKAFRSDGAGNPNTDTPANNGGDGKPRLTGRRQRQLESATGARGKGPGVANGIPEDGDEQTIWDAFEKQERREAQRA